MPTNEITCATLLLEDDSSKEPDGFSHLDALKQVIVSVNRKQQTSFRYLNAISGYVGFPCIDLGATCSKHRHQPLLLSNDHFDPCHQGSCKPHGPVVFG